MSGKHLLDTSIIVALFKNDAAVRTRIGESAEVFVPVIAVGELYYGAGHSAHVDQNVRQVREFAASSTVLNCDAATGEHYGQIKSQLRAQGRPLPENDIWIAAIASQHALTIVTRDVHFKEIAGVVLEAW